MPHYEYVCTNGHRTEVVHGINAPGPETCPICGAPMRKAFIAPTIHFKGSGWAKVDRRSGSRSKAKDAEEAPPPAAGDGTSGTSGTTGSSGASAESPTGSKDAASTTTGTTTTDSSAKPAAKPTPTTKSASTD